MVTNLESLEVALQHHRAGEMDQAERLYKEILRIDPQHADALHLAGVLEHQRNRNEESIDLISRAISTNSNVSLYHSNLGASYRELGKFDRAVECFQNAIRIDPSFAGAHYNLGMAMEASGQNEKAVACYREALEYNPDFFAAFNNLGKIYASEKQLDQAVECFREAAKIAPGLAEMHYNLGNSLAGSGEVDEAVECFREAIRLNPLVAEFHNNLGTALKERAEFTEAFSCFKKAIELKSDYDEARYNLGSSLLASGQLSEAVDNYRKALALDPNNLDVRCRLATTLRHQSRYEDAAQILREGLQLDPSHAESHFGLGTIYQSEGKQDDALKCYHNATRVNPDHRAAWTRIGSIYCSGDRLNEAIDCFKNALRADPQYAEAHYNLGNVYKDQWRLDEAVECYQRALKSDPRLTDAHIDLGAVFKYQGKLDDAICQQTRALEIEPCRSKAHFYRSETRLLHGDFENGWPEYEWRWKSEIQPRQFLPPDWDGTSLIGRSLLVHAEQGVCDEIMFASCLPDLVGRTATCIIECDPRLVPLFARSFPLATVVARPAETEIDLETSYSSLDAQISFGSLPQYLRSSSDQFPVMQRYLVPDPKLREKWRARLDELGAELKVGLSWSGASKPENRRLHSAQFKQWTNLFSISGIQFVNLQSGDSREDLQAIREQTGVKIHDWDDADPLNDLDDFAARVAELDLVISVDNSTVHLAGAVGVPVWTLLPSVPNWRWMLDREDSLWYPTMKLYRQQESEDWEPVIERVAKDLKKVVDNSSTLHRNAGEAESESLKDTETERKKYEHIWTHDVYREKSPGLLDIDKAPLVEKLREYGVKTILDAGCGSGKLMQKFLTEYPDEFEIRGFDISKNCLDPWFDDIKNEILSVGSLWNPDDLSKQFDAVICTDVMEHIPTKHVPAVLCNLKNSTSKLCYLAVALFADGYGPKLVGEPLHLTVKEPYWWFVQMESAGFKIDSFAVEKLPSGHAVWFHVFAYV